MISKTIIVAITLAFVAGSIVSGSTAFAAPGDKGQPFEALAETVAALQLQIEALQLQITELTFTQTEPDETVIQVDLAEDATASPLIISDSDENDVFTIFPDGAVRIGFNTVTINPDGSAPGLDIKEDNLKDKSIGGEKLKDKTIGQDKIKDKAIGKDKIKDKAVGQGQLEDKAVGQGQLKDKAVGQGQLKDKAVGKGQLADKAVGKGQLEDKAVGRGQLEDRAVGQGQIAEGAVTSFHIEDGTITASDVASGTFVSISDDEIITGEKTFTSLIRTSLGSQLRILEGTPVTTNTFSGGMPVGDENTFVVFDVGPAGGPATFECIESKPASTVIVLGFANDVTVAPLAGCGSPFESDIALAQGSSPSFSEGDVLVLIQDVTDETWVEAARITS